MSVVIIVKVSEGLVLAADSAATIMGSLIHPERGVIQEGVLKTYFNGKKLLQVGDYPIGVVYWGTAQIGLRTVESIIREWEYNQGWRYTIDHNRIHGPDTSYTVKDCAESLQDHLTKFYSEFDKKNPPRPIGLVVAGYPEGAFFPKIWRFTLTVDGGSGVVDARPDQNDKPDFGAHWFGSTDAIKRLHFGRDDKVIEVISGKYNLDAQDVSDTLGPLQYQIPFAVMPLQDAIDYAYYMINVAIGRYRFVLGPELCGGPIEIAVITQQEFSWISRKTWTLNS